MNILNIYTFLNKLRTKLLISIKFIENKENFLIIKCAFQKKFDNLSNAEEAVYSAFKNIGYDVKNKIYPEIEYKGIFYIMNGFTVDISLSFFNIEFKRNDDNFFNFDDVEEDTDDYSYENVAKILKVLKI